MTEQNGNLRYPSIELMATREWHEYISAVWDGDATWAESPAEDYGIFRSHFRSVRDQLISHGYVRWVNPAEHSQGTAWTPAGYVFFNIFIGSPVPSPYEETTQEYWESQYGSDDQDRDEG